jgi:hypothetical protein
MKTALRAFRGVAAGLFAALACVTAQEPPAATPTAPAPPPSAPAQRSAAELEKLAMPIALHPDPLIAILLPASVYPPEIVEAARFVKDTNNRPKLDEQTCNWIAGFGLVAWPAEHGNAGIMTFIGNQQGRVYEKDLGAKTAQRDGKLRTFDPAPGWRLSAD